MIPITGENYQIQKAKTDVIDKLLQELKRDTAMYSTFHHVTRHDNFLKLIEMGDIIIPYLFHRITHYGSDRVYHELLRQITNEMPVAKEHVGKFIFETIAWLNWYVNSKYYPSDIYFGLVNV